MGVLYYGYCILVDYFDHFVLLFVQGKSYEESSTTVFACQQQ
jgi:hypothetical protein